ncbi:hypothetical protein Anapl_13234 [Anas platyrhynchos]|uniref:Uncharacterized protein n=1 Tax=Anas platyrhynchos TaxID=8839 RepID=R0JJT5_ANAPL|nr:hypothetical protein Anapl_13234 [Anas platyrhynchos]
MSDKEIYTPGFPVQGVRFKVPSEDDLSQMVDEMVLSEVQVGSASGEGCCSCLSDTSWKKKSWRSTPQPLRKARHLETEIVDERRNRKEKELEL